MSNDSTTAAPGNGARATARPVTPGQAPPRPAVAQKPATAPGAVTSRPTAPPKVSRLSQAKKGRLHKPPRICIYGAKKIGKTTLACAAPQPLLIDANQGSDYLDVSRYPFYPGEASETVPRTFADLMDGLADIRDTPSEYRTLVVDVLADIEPLIWQHIIKEDSGRESLNNPKAKTINSIEDYGFAKGYNIAVDRGWVPFLRMLDDIRDRRQMAIVLLEHTSIAEFKNPTGEDYNRHTMKIHKHAAGTVAGWVDVLAFYSFDDLASRRPGAKRAQGVYSGRRVLHVDHDAVFDGGSRIPLPPEVEVAMEDPWAPFAAAIEEGQAMPPEHILADIRTELARIGDEELANRLEAWVAGRPVDQLWRCLSGLRHKPSIHDSDNAAGAPQEG